MGRKMYLHSARKAGRNKAPGLHVDHAAYRNVSTSTGELVLHHTEGVGAQCKEKYGMYTLIITVSRIILVKLQGSSFLSKMVRGMASEHSVELPFVDVANVRYLRSNTSEGSIFADTSLNQRSVHVQLDLINGEVVDLYTFEATTTMYHLIKLMWMRQRMNCVARLHLTPYQGHNCEQLYVSTLNILNAPRDYAEIVEVTDDFALECLQDLALKRHAFQSQHLVHQLIKVIGTAERGDLCSQSLPTRVQQEQSLQVIASALRALHCLLYSSEGVEFRYALVNNAGPTVRDLLSIACADYLTELKRWRRRRRRRAKMEARGEVLEGPDPFAATWHGAGTVQLTGLHPGADSDRDGAGAGHNDENTPATSSLRQSAEGNMLNLLRATSAMEKLGRTPTRSRNDLLSSSLPGPWGEHAHPHGPRPPSASSASSGGGGGGGGMRRRASTRLLKALRSPGLVSPGPGSTRSRGSSGPGSLTPGGTYRSAKGDDGAYMHQSDSDDTDSGSDEEYDRTGESRADKRRQTIAQIVSRSMMAPGGVVGGEHRGGAPAAAAGQGAGKRFGRTVSAGARDQLNQSIDFDNDGSESSESEGEYTTSRRQSSYRSSGRPPAHGRDRSHGDGIAGARQNQDPSVARAVQRRRTSSAVTVLGGVMRRASINNHAGMEDLMQSVYDLQVCFLRELHVLIMAINAGGPSSVSNVPILVAGVVDVLSLIEIMVMRLVILIGDTQAYRAMEGALRPIRPGSTLDNTIDAERGEDEHTTRLVHGRGADRGRPPRAAVGTPAANAGARAGVVAGGGGATSSATRACRKHDASSPSWSDRIERNRRDTVAWLNIYESPAGVAAVAATRSRGGGALGSANRAHQHRKDRSKRSSGQGGRGVQRRPFSAATASSEEEQDDERGSATTSEPPDSDSDLEAGGDDTHSVASSQASSVHNVFGYEESERPASRMRSPTHGTALQTVDEEATRQSANQGPSSSNPGDASPPGSMFNLSTDEDEDEDDDGDASSSVVSDSSMESARRPPKIKTSQSPLPPLGSTRGRQSHGDRPGRFPDVGSTPHKGGLSTPNPPSRGDSFRQGSRQDRGVHTPPESHSPEPSESFDSLYCAPLLLYNYVHLLHAFVQDSPEVRSFIRDEFEEEFRLYFAELSFVGFLMESRSQLDIMSFQLIHDSCILILDGTTRGVPPALLQDLGGDTSADSKPAASSVGEPTASAHRRYGRQFSEHVL